MNSVRIIPLGGSAQVTRNMFAYEFRVDNKTQDILLIDCGIGFPDESMYGVDYLVPDISYLKNKLNKIRGLVLTHGHMDHIGALRYILPQLNTPVYATRLTAALAEVGLKEFGIKNRINVVDNDKKLVFGNFRVLFIHVTHSIPDAANLVINTPIGTIYHGSDYKFDWTPINGQQTEVDKIVQAAGKNGVLCLLSDCVRSEREGHTLSERVVEDSLQIEMKNCQGKFIFSTFSSNISRVQQAINAAQDNNRLICFLGRSMKQNIQVAKSLKYLNYQKNSVVTQTQLKNIPAQKLTLIVTGSQGEPGSILTRVANSEFPSVSISKGDKVVFSSDPIPGNESAVGQTIDLLAKQGADVIYTDIHDNLHVSGHGAQSDLSLMLALTRPKYIVPIGGEYKQMIQYKKLALKMGYKDQNIFLLERGQTLIFDSNKRAKLGDRIKLQNVLVDGLGIGDVGSIILRDRKHLADEGFLIVIVPYDINNKQVVGGVEIVSRGFIFKDKRLMEKTKKRVYAALDKSKGRDFDWKYLRRKISDDLERFFYTQIRRNPLVIPVIVEI